MRNDDDLGDPREASQPASDLDRRPAANTSVHLVEYERRNRICAREDDFDGEHDARQLAATGPLRQWPRRRTGMRRQQHLDVVRTVRAVVGAGAHVDGHDGVWHGEVA